jgi:hypothetical protein
LKVGSNMRLSSRMNLNELDCNAAFDIHTGK